MYRNDLNSGRPRDNSSRSDPQGYQQRRHMNDRATEDEIRRVVMSRASPVNTRPPLSRTTRCQEESDQGQVIYNSFTSADHGQSTSDRRDPPPMSSIDSERSRRVIFSQQLEIHEKQKPQTPSTPTVPILRSSSRSRHNFSAWQSAVNSASAARDPTPRSNEKRLRSSDNKKTIADILNGHATKAPSRPEASSDPPLDRSRRPLFSPAAPKSPRDILSKLELRSKSTSLLEKRKISSDRRQLIEPEAPTAPPVVSILQSPAQNRWDMSELFPGPSQPSTPLGMHSSNLSRDTTLSSRSNLPPAPASDSKLLGLKAFAPRMDHWDAPDLYPDSWKRYLEDSSPSNASSESQDACLLPEHEKTLSDGEQNKSGMRTNDENDENFSNGQHGIFHTESSSVGHAQRKLSSRLRFTQLDGEGEANRGTELVLVPRVPEQIDVQGSGFCLGGSEAQKAKGKGLGSLLKRSVPGSSKVPFQALPVIAMSFEESIDLKKGTDETSDSNSWFFNSKAQTWDNIDRNSIDRDEDDELLMPRYDGSFRRKWRFVGMLVCLVVTCLCVGLPTYFIMAKDNDALDAKVYQPHEMGECTDKVADDTELSTRYREIRKVVMGITKGDSSSVDEPGSPQRKALCWISDFDKHRVSIESNNISAVMQRYTLAVLYYSLVIEGADLQRSLANTDFLTSTHECNWGVVMCSAPKTVTALILADKVLTGPLPSEIANLRSLSFLELSLNELSGTIPTSLSSLSLLEYFAVAFNSFTGSIPTEIGLLTKLEFVNMRSSQIEGAIPSEIGQLSRLETLLLEGNWLSGTIPATLGYLVKAQQMSFRKNYLTGRVNNDLCELREISLMELKVDSWIECDCCTS